MYIHAIHFFVYFSQLPPALGRKPDSSNRNVVLVSYREAVELGSSSRGVRTHVIENHPLAVLDQREVKVLGELVQSAAAVPPDGGGESSRVYILSSSKQPCLL